MRRVCVCFEDEKQDNNSEQGGEFVGNTIAKRDRLRWYDYIFSIREEIRIELFPVILLIPHS